MPKSCVHVDQTLGYSNSSWIDIGSCLRRQIPQYKFRVQDEILYHTGKEVTDEWSLVIARDSLSIAI